MDCPGTPGAIRPRQFDPRAASPATVHEHSYHDAASTGSWCTIGGPVLADGAFDFGCLYFPVRLPGTQTQYLSTGPNLVWQTSYGQSPTPSAGGPNHAFGHLPAGPPAPPRSDAQPV